MSRPPSEPQKSPEPTAPPEPTESPDPAVLAPSPTATPTTAAIRPGAGLTALLRRLHFYAGILVAPFLIVAAVSGGLYALAPSIEQWAYRDLLHTESTGAHLPLTRQVTEAVEARPDLELSAVRPADGDGATTRVLFTDPALGPSERHAVFIDPVTGAVLGESVSYGSGAALPFRTWVSELHRHLHLGEAGRLYSELAASWLAVVALGGLILWIRTTGAHVAIPDAVPGS